MAAKNAVRAPTHVITTSAVGPYSRRGDERSIR